MPDPKLESQGAAARLVAGRIVLDETSEQVLVDGEVVPVRGKPYRLLRELMRRPGELVTKERLLDTVWDGRPHSDAVITTAIKEVRRALGDTPKEPWAVETVHGRGYRFLPEVTLQVANKDERAAAVQSSQVTRRWLAAAAILTMAALVVIFGPERGAPLRSVGVLPFDDMTIDGDHRWFADGLTEELLNELMQVQDLDVAARNSAARFRDSELGVDEIGRALGVSHVIEGSIRNSDEEEIRLTVQLIRAEDGFHEWSMTWDRDLSVSSALDIQKDISERVVELMQVSPQGPDERESLATMPDDAWESLLKGRELVERRSADSINAGLALLRKTVAISPDLPQGHAALASAHLLAAEAAQLPREISIATAAQHADRALELDPRSVEALVASSFVALAKGDRQASVEYADRAIAIAPAYSQAYQRRGVALILLGRIEDAYQALSRARQLDPLTPVILSNLSHVAQITGRIAEAHEVARDNVRWNPGDHVASTQLGRLELELGNYEQALACLRDSISTTPRDSLAARKLGELYWRIGAYERALSVADYVSGAGTRSVVYLSQGTPERALQAASVIDHSTPTGITPLDIYYWAGEIDIAANWATRFIAMVGGVENMTADRPLPDDAVTAFIVLEATGNDAAAEMSSMLAERYDSQSPVNAVLFGDLIAGAQWSAWLGDRESTLAWLSQMSSAGMVAPEVQIDPVFDAFRDDPRFAEIAMRMRTRADGLIELLSDSLVCGAPGPEPRVAIMLGSSWSDH